MYTTDIRNLTVGAWDDGFFVEQADPTDVTILRQIAGPFETRREADAWIEKMWRCPNKTRDNL